MRNITGKVDFDTDRFSLDSSVIVAFFNSNLEDILFEIFKGKTCFTPAIFKEINRYDLSTFDYNIIGFNTVEESEYFYHLSMHHISFSAADVQLITICKFHNSVCVSFEKKIRRICDKENIKNIGLFSILEKAIEMGLISRNEAVVKVTRLRSDGLYLSNKVFNEIINEF